MLVTTAPMPSSVGEVAQQDVDDARTKHELKHMSIKVVPGMSSRNTGAAHADGEAGAANGFQLPNVYAALAELEGAINVGMEQVAVLEQMDGDEDVQVQNKAAEVLTSTAKQLLRGGAQHTTMQSDVPPAAERRLRTAQVRPPMRLQIQLRASQHKIQQTIWMCQE